MFGNSVHGNERIIAKEYVDRIGGDVQLQNIFKVLLEDIPEDYRENLEKLEETIEKLEESNEKLEADLYDLKKKYDDLQTKWDQIGGDVFL